MGKLTDEDEHFQPDREKLVRRPTPLPRPHSSKHFVRVPVWWAEVTAGGMSPDFLIAIELLHLHWKTGPATFSFPSERLRRAGVSRKAKVRVLRGLERVGLIRVDWRRRSSPVVTMTVPVW
jgi:hypothetical protein